MVNRGNGSPTFNVVIFAFLDPLAIAQQTTDDKTTAGVPNGMTKKAIDFFKSKGIAVMFSIGGEVWSTDGRWDKALANPADLAHKVAVIAKQFGVGMEIDYEVDSSAYAAALDTFVQTYRTLIPAVPNNPATYLTVDMGAGTGYLTAISKLASQWLNQSKIQWANAMVTGGPYGSIGEATQYWEQHLDGVHWAGIPPMKPQQLVVSLYSASGSTNCHEYDGTVLQGAVPWVQQKSTRGIFFWAGGCQSSNPSSCITNCQGVEKGSQLFLG